MSSPSDPNPALAGFRRGLADGRSAHAYLISGPPRGAGGDLAVAMLQMLFCNSEPGGCGTCRGCRLAAERKHPDILWVEPELKSRAIAIEVVRESLIPALSQTSLEGGWKAAVILGADRLRVEAANAFLKTLEEPPPRTLILMVTDAPHEMLPTILSRCQWMAAPGGGTSAPEPWRSRLLDLLAGGGGSGAIGRLGMADRMSALLVQLEEAVEEEVEAAASDDTDSDVLKARISARFVEVRRSLLQELMLWQRDLLAVVLGLPDAALRNPARAGALRREAAGLSYADALDRVRRVEEMDRRFLRNMSNDVVLSAFFREIPCGGGPPR